MSNYYIVFNTVLFLNGIVKVKLHFNIPSSHNKISFVINMSFIPGNGIYVVQGEMSLLLTAMRRVTRWSSHSHQVGLLSFLAKISLVLNTTLIAILYYTYACILV